MIRSTLCKMVFSLALILTAGAYVLAQPANETPAPPAAAKKVSNEQLFDYFKGIDAEAKQVAGKGAVIFTLRYAHKGMNIPLTISVNDGYVWVNCPVANLADASKLPAEVLLKMLKSQADIGPTFFRIVRAGKSDLLEIGHRIDRPADLNRMTAAFQELAGDIEATQGIWSGLDKRDPVK
ncbi:MAG: hypothetical protein K2X38_16760 [Gemmataceae bacterium]|nr:hypothetical protein [Gemmataceae bacterium]